MLIWQFRTKNFRTRLVAEYDECGTDLSWDKTGEVREKIESGEWAVYVFTVEVRDARGRLVGESSLGGSIYADPAEFRDHIGLAIRARADGLNYGSYFTGMVSEAIAEARKVYAERPTLRQVAA